MLRSLLAVVFITASLMLGCCESRLLADPPAAPLVVTVDASEAPELLEWGDKAKAICIEQYPIVCALLDSEGFKPRASIKIVFKGDMGGTPAATGGDTISVNAPYVLQHKDDFGMMVHELCHVVQRYGRGRRNMGWMTEGIADWVRWHKYEPGMDKQRIDPKTATYHDSYRTTARFLAYVADAYDKDVVKKLNALMRKGECDETAFKTLVGKDVDTLWKEFIGTLDQRGRPRDPKLTKEPQTSTLPAFSIYNFGGNGRGAEFGVVFACWPDGLVIFARDPEHGGVGLQAGRITSEQVQAAVNEMWAAGIFDVTYKPGMVPDAVFNRLIVRRDGKTVSHECMESPYRLIGAQAGADPEFRRFAKIWAVSRAIIAFAYPTDYKPLDQDPQAQKRLKDAEAVNAFFVP